MEQWTPFEEVRGRCIWPPGPPPIEALVRQATGDESNSRDKVAKGAQWRGRPCGALLQEQGQQLQLQEQQHYSEQDAEQLVVAGDPRLLQPAEPEVGRPRAVKKLHATPHRMRNISWWLCSGRLGGLVLRVWAQVGLSPREANLVAHARLRAGQYNEPGTPVLTATEAAGMGGEAAGLAAAVMEWEEEKAAAIAVEDFELVRPAATPRRASCCRAAPARPPAALPAASQVVSPWRAWVEERALSGEAPCAGGRAAGPGRRGWRAARAA
jgi:hypothetical protein